MEISIRNRWDNKIIVSGKYESIKECLEKNRGADLGGAYLRGADLEGAKRYSESHVFAQEIIKRQEIKTFTDKEWSIIGQIIIRKICWGKIKKDFGKDMIPILKKLEKAGFKEYIENYG